MTPADRAACLATLGWTMVDLAVRLGINEATVRHWQAARRTPRAEIDDWIALLAREIGPHRTAIARILADHLPPPRPVCQGGVMRR